jgi:hypothetical protein
MIKKGNKLYSILFSKCPKCHQENIFKSANPYNLKQFADMHLNCPVCGQSSDPEPGFYYGAMYVSYALAVGLGIFIGSIMLLMEFSAMAVIIAISTLLVVLAPLNFRYSRMIWINLFYHYNKYYSSENAISTQNKM